MNNEELAQLQRQFNKVFELPQVQALLPRMPNFRYWQVKGDHYAYCWTTQRCSNGKFYAMIYRVLKNGTWKIKKRVAFGRRSVAKKRAYKWFLQREKLLADKQRETK